MTMGHTIFKFFKILVQEEVKEMTENGDNVVVVATQFCVSTK